MKKHEIIKYMNITSDIHAKMPDIEQVRANCLNQTTDEISTGILSAIKIKQKPLWIKRVTIITAVIMMTMIMLVSATKLLISIKVFDFDGNPHIIDISYESNLSVPTTDNPNDSDQKLYHQKFISDYDEFIKYMEGDIFKLPQYIPDGYDFSAATVIFFDENRDNLKSIFVSYEKNGTFISYSIDLLAPDALDNLRFGGIENTESEVLQLPQFYRNILLSHDFRIEESGGIFTQYSFLALNSIPVKEYMGNEYGTIQYSINSMHITRNEIINMAESIK